MPTSTASIPRVSHPEHSFYQGFGIILCLLYTVSEPSALFFTCLFAVFRLSWKVCFGLLFTHCSNLNQFEEVKPGYWVVVTPWTSHLVSCSSDNISFAITQVPRLRDKWSWFFCNDHTKGIPFSQDEPLKICIIWGNVLPLALGVCSSHRLYSVLCEPGAWRQE